MEGYDKVGEWGFEEGGASGGRGPVEAGLGAKVRWLGTLWG
jgi:hypothetical protein